MLLVIISRYTSQRVWLSCIGPLVLLLPKHEIIWLSNLSIMSVPDEGFSRNMRTKFDIYVFYLNKGNNKITEHPKGKAKLTSQQTDKSVNNRKSGKTAMALTWYRHFGWILLRTYIFGPCSRLFSFLFLFVLM